MIIQPKIRGFICTTAHPEGCTKQVENQIQYVKQQPPIQNGPKKVLIIGASTGYGLASRIVAAFGAGAQTIGVFFEKPADSKRTASAGWYNSGAFEHAAQRAGLYAKSINGDAFSQEIKQKTLQLIEQDWQGQVDLIIYSLASPRRITPAKTFNSVLKPIGKSYTSKTIDVMSGQISEMTLPAATDDEIEQTVAVMGGEDWALWIEALITANFLAKNALTVAYSYIGPSLTYPIYREGTIGRAKAHLESTALLLNQKLKALSARALISVNKALVTQASAAIPVVPLYISLLYKVMKQKNLHEGCIEQITRLFSEHLYHHLPENHLIHLDDREMRTDIQQQINAVWPTLTSENILSTTDLAGYRQEFHQLFGFEVEGINYNQEVSPTLEIPSLL